MLQRSNQKDTRDHIMYGLLGQGKEFGFYFKDEKRLWRF